MLTTAKCDLIVCDRKYKMVNITVTVTYTFIHTKKHILLPWQELSTFTIYQYMHDQLPLFGGEITPWTTNCLLYLKSYGFLKSLIYYY